MPTYQYACTECDERLEVHQSFTDDALTVCPACEGRLRKVFNAVGVVFKGSGFYKTDSRQPSAASAKDSSAKESGGKESSGKDTSGDKGSGKESTSSSGSGGRSGDSSGGSAKSSAA